jgi:hypothetical protein
VLRDSKENRLRLKKLEYAPVKKRVDQLEAAWEEELVSWKELDFKFKDKVRELAIERHTYEHRRNWQQYVGSD